MNDRLRLPPHSVEAEQAVLGALILSNSAFDRIADALTEKDFYRHDHRLLFRAIAKLVDENKGADIFTLHEHFKREGKVEEVGGMSYLHQISASCPSAANIRHYAGIVREHAQRRALIDAATGIAEEAYGSGTSADELADRAQAKILEATRDRGVMPGKTLSSYLAEAMTRLDELHRNPASVTGIATGFVDLDEMTTGLQAGDLILIAGRPSMGKTALALNIAEHVALEQHLPVQVFSMEMGGAQLANRFLASASKVDAHRMRTGRLDPADWERLSVGLGKLNPAIVEIDESPALSPMEVRARARRFHREHGRTGLIVIDYVQLMQGNSSADTRTEELGEVSRSLKTMAKELQCPVIALSQLNRSLEQRSNRRPIMSDLRESGALEADADMIFFIYRDEVYNDNSPDKGTADIIIGKQRNGPIGTVRLAFMGRHTRFENYVGMVNY